MGNQAFLFFLSGSKVKQGAGREGRGRKYWAGEGRYSFTAAVRNLTRSVYRNLEDIFKDCFFNKNFHGISKTGVVAPDANRPEGLDHKYEVRSSFEKDDWTSTKV